MVGGFRAMGSVHVLFVASAFFAGATFTTAEVAGEPTALEVVAAPASGESFPQLTSDGAWCWIGEPRAVFHEGGRRQTYTGWITRSGTVQVCSYDHATCHVEIATIRDGFEADDHSNPSILVRPDGRLMVFYSPHCRTVIGSTPTEGAIEGMFYRVSERPEDVRSWGPEIRLDMNVGVEFGWTYPMPVQLPHEGNRIYLFWRGGDGQPVLALSDDGEEWLLGGSVLWTGGRRPYLKVCPDGVGGIHLAFTKGHPAGEPENGLFYVHYRGGAMHHADGTKIKDMWDLPLEPGEYDTIYAGREHGRAWIWDVAADSIGRPVVAYAVFPTESDHRYRYARWDGTRWQDAEVAAGGAWFPQEDSGKLNQQVYYSGGMTLDHSDPRVLYLSRPQGGVHEIERWETRDGGLTWVSEPVTSSSAEPNVRPVVPVDHAPGGPELLWMHGGYLNYNTYSTAIRALVSPAVTADRESAIAALMRQVFRHELGAIARGDRSSGTYAVRRDGLAELVRAGWKESVFYAGVMAAYGATGDGEYLSAARDWAGKNEWTPGPRARHADDLCAAQVYLDIWSALPSDERVAPMLAPVRAAFDEMRASPRPGRDEWHWCDALFSVPPGLASLSEVTTDPGYLDLMDAMWWDTTEFLYDAGERLYYRDKRFKPPDGTMLDPSSEEKVFWARGNGWVMAGVARVLDHMPSDHPSREKYVRLMNEMAGRVVGLQGSDGLWRTDLLSPSRWPEPETSSTALFCYAIAWGVNHGVLDREMYAPVVRRAWEGLAGAVDGAGKLGGVQGVSDSPGPVSADSTTSFGAGAFLLAASEVLILERGDAEP